MNPTGGRNGLFFFSTAFRNAAVSRPEWRRHSSEDEEPKIIDLAPMLLRWVLPSPRSRVGFTPKPPQGQAGMRIDPPAWLPCASGTMPAATAAADPPLDPPAV